MSAPESAATFDEVSDVVVGDPAVDAATRARLDALANKVENMSVRGSSGGAERRIQVGAEALLVIGVVMVAGAWWGASGTTRLHEQMSYLISGGIGGIALILVGATLYLRVWLARQRYWLARLVAEQQAATAALLGGAGASSGTARGSGGE